jgi:hypothetical protein
MTSEFLALVSGAALSLAFSYIPGLRNWFDALEGDHKRLVMLGVTFLSALGIFGLACIGRYEGVSCDVDGLWQLLELFVLAAIANQGAYQLTPKGNA